MVMFGAWLRRAREGFGLTQEQLGRMIGASASAVGMYEQGRRTPGAVMEARLRWFWRERGVEMPEIRAETPEEPGLVEELRSLGKSPARRGKSGVRTPGRSRDDRGVT